MIRIDLKQNGSGLSQPTHLLRRSCKKNFENDKSMNSQNAPEDFLSQRMDVGYINDAVFHPMDIQSMASMAKRYGASLYRGNKKVRS